MPQDSRYQTILRDTLEIDEAVDGNPVFGPWSLENYQLAGVIDSVNRLSVALAGGDMPEPSPRPQVKRRTGPTPAALAYLQEIRDRHRREAAS